MEELTIKILPYPFDTSIEIEAIEQTQFESALVIGDRYVAMGAVTTGEHSKLRRMYLEPDGGSLRMTVDWLEEINLNITSEGDDEKRHQVAGNTYNLNWSEAEGLRIERDDGVEIGEEERKRLSQKFTWLSPNPRPDSLITEVNGRRVRVGDPIEISQERIEEFTRRLPVVGEAVVEKFVFSLHEVREVEGRPQAVFVLHFSISGEKGDEKARCEGVGEHLFWLDEQLPGSSSLQGNIFIEQPMELDNGQIGRLRMNGILQLQTKINYGITG
jgi:hypothetical protein